MIFTTEAYNQMVERCKAIAVKFKQQVLEQRENLDPMNEDDIDDYGVSEENIQSLFDMLKAEMHVESELGFFRDNDEEYGRYCEHNDFVSLPLCINYYPEGEIVEHMTHELYHAFQYCAICTPENYPCFNEVAIKTWGYEFKNYISGDKNMRQYLGQEIEKSARAFGEMMGKA